jgi:hypothetical protein
MVLKSIFLLVIAATSIHLAQAQTVRTIGLQAFDPACGQSGHNCRDAFQKALAAMAKAGGGTLLLPAGTFPVEFPEVAQNVHSGPALARSSLIVVPPNVVIRGHVGADGTFDSIIQWSNTSIPAFIFANASRSGMKDLHLQFTGTMPTLFSYFDTQLQQSLGYRQAKAQGGPYELFSFAYVFNSDNCTFDHLLV